MVVFKKSQAILEMGLFGSILLVIVITLLSYQQTLDDKQFLVMKSFRDALKIAGFNLTTDSSTGTVYSKGANVTLNEVEHRRHVTGDFYGKGSRSVASDSAYVYWGTPGIDAQDNPDGSVDIKVYNLDTIQRYRINNTDYDTDGKLKMAYKEDSNQSHSLSENNSAINNNYDLDLTDKVDISFDGTATDTQYLTREDGRYSYEAGGSKTVHRHISWNSPK